MNEKKQTTQTSDTVVTPGVFWGTIALGLISSAISAYAVYYILQPVETVAKELQTVLYILFLIGSLGGIFLTIGKRQFLGVRLILGVLWVFGLTSVTINQGRAVASAFSVLFVSAVAISTLFPKSSRNRYFGIAGAVFILSWIIEWINPPWRVPSTAAALGPIVAVVFGILVIIAIAVQVWRTGNTLRNKMIVAFLAVTLIPLVIVSYITYTSSQTALTDDANQKLQSAAAQTAGDIDQFMDLNLQNIRAAGKYPALVDYLNLPLSQRTGSPEEERAIKLVTAMSRQDPVFISSVAVYNTKGITLLDSYAADIGKDKSSRNYFQQTMATGLPFVSEVEHSATSGVPSLYFAAPVRDVAGKVLGIVRIRYAASILQKLIIADSGTAGESSYAVLLTPEHIRLAHGSNRERVYKSIVPLKPDVLKKLQDQGLMPAGTPEQLSTNLPGFEAGLNNLKQAPFFASDTNGDGALEEAAVATMTTKPWQVAYIQSESVFLAPITAQTTNNLLATAVVAVLVGVAGFFFSQSLSGPIVRLTHVAEAIASGDINIQAKVETSDEVGTLAATFNRMTQQLRDFITGLEVRVAARTKDLATVAEVGTATSTILETEKLLKTIAELTKERFGLYHSHVYLLDESGQNLVLTAGAGEAGRIMAAEKRSIPLTREQSLVARAAREKKGVTVNDVTQAPDFLANPLLPNTRSELAAPMLVGDTLIGVFDIQSDQVGRFTESDINIQTTLAAQLASSVQNARSYERSKAQADFETLVNEIGQKIQHAGTVEDALQVAVRELGTALGTARVKVNIQSTRDEAHVRHN